jgi:hypothetical protein
MDDRVLSELDWPAPNTSWTQTAIDTNTPFSIRIRMSVRRIVEAFVGRRDDRSHVFKKIREHLSLETTRGRCRNTVLRVEPCLFCLYALIVYWFDHLPRRNRETIHVNWAGKTSITFSDALPAVRYNAWDKYLFPQAMPRTTVQKDHRTQEDGNT